MARQKANNDKPNHKSFKNAKGGGKNVRAAQVKKFKSEGKKRGPKEIDMRGAGNTGPCQLRCGYCVTCKIAVGDAENASRMRRSYSWY